MIRRGSKTPVQLYALRYGRNPEQRREDPAGPESDTYSRFAPSLDHAVRVLAQTAIACNRPWAAVLQRGNYLATWNAGRVEIVGGVA